MNMFDLSTQSIYRIENELRDLENKFSDIRRVVAWRKIRVADEEFNQFMDAEIIYINEVIDLCHNRIAEVKFTEDEPEFYAVLADIDLNLNALGQLIKKIENYSEKYSYYCYGTV